MYTGSKLKLLNSFIMLTNFELFYEEYRKQAEYLKRNPDASAYLKWQHFKMLVFFQDNRHEFLKYAQKTGKTDEYEAFLREYPELVPKPSPDKKDVCHNDDTSCDLDLQEIY